MRSEAEEFLGLEEEAGGNSEEVEFGRRIKYVAIAWSLALLGATPIGLVALPYYPMGIMTWFSRFFDNDHDSTTPLVVGWAMYLTLTTLVITRRRRRLFYSFFGLLVVILLVNTVSCYCMIPF